MGGPYNDSWDRSFIDQQIYHKHLQNCQGPPVLQEQAQLIEQQKAHNQRMFDMLRGMQNSRNGAVDSDKSSEFDEALLLLLD